MDDTLVIQEGTTYIGTRAYEKREDIVSVSFPNSVTKIFDKAFYGCKNIKVFDLPWHIEYIGRFAFGSTKAVIFVPCSIREINEYAFSKEDIVFFECGKDDFKGYHVIEHDDCPPPDYYHRGGYSLDTEKYCFERGCQMFFKVTHEEFLQYIKEHL